MVFLVRQSAPLGLLYYRICNRMRIVLLKAGRKAQHLALFSAAEGHDLRDCRSSVGQGSGLVENYRVRRGNSLKEAPARIADSTAIGIESFSAQEKSTISTASVFVTLRVTR